MESISRTKGSDGDGSHEKLRRSRCLSAVRRTFSVGSKLHLGLFKHQFLFHLKRQHYSVLSSHSLREADVIHTWR